MERAIRRAARRIRRGRLVVFPTETVYGLGADATNARAVARVFAAKQRPADNPLIVHIASVEHLRSVAASPTAMERSLLQAFSPGPFTLVLNARDDLPRAVTAGLGTVAVRIPDHPLALDLLQAAMIPIAAPSANRSGEPSPTTLEMARRSLKRRGVTYLNGGSTRVGLESTVARLVGQTVIILRPGAVTETMITERFPSLTVGSGEAADDVRSPGTRHRHYHPRASVVTIEEAIHARALSERSGAKRLAVVGLDPDVGLCLSEMENAVGPAAMQVVVRRAMSLAEYASSLYRWFSELDDEGVQTIAALLPPNEGLGRAIRDRLLRASGAHPPEGV